MVTYWIYCPPWLPHYWPGIIALGVGFVALGVGGALWTLGCLRMAFRGDWLPALLFLVGGIVVWGSAMFGRWVVDVLRGCGWACYTLPGVGWVCHRDLGWIGDDGYVWGFVGFGLGISGIALTSIGPRRRAGGAS